MSIIQPSDIIKESYDLLYTELDSTLKDTLGLFNGTSNNDILLALQVKLKNLRLNYSLDLDVLSEVTALEEEISSCILRAFANEFYNQEDDEIETKEVPINDISPALVANFIYKNFYLNRKQLLEDFVINKILNEKSSLAKRYKTSNTVKDITYKSIRSELKDVKNQDYYVVLMYSDEIIDDILLDEEITLEDIFQYSDLTELDIYLMEELFLNSKDNSIIASNLVNSLKNCSVYDFFKSNLRNRLFLSIKSNG